MEMSYTSASQITLFILSPMTFLCFLGGGSEEKAWEISWLCQPFNCAPEPLVYSPRDSSILEQPKCLSICKWAQKKLSLTMQLDPTPP